MSQCCVPSPERFRRPHANFYHKNMWSTVCSTEISKTLQAAVALARSQVSFKPEDVSTKSMRIGGVMSLLLTRVSTDTISLSIKSRSNIMMCYLHTSTLTFTAGLVARMVHHSDYALIATSHGVWNSFSTHLGLIYIFFGNRWLTWNMISAA